MLTFFPGKFPVENLYVKHFYASKIISFSTYSYHHIIKIRTAYRLQLSSHIDFNYLRNNNRYFIINLFMLKIKKSYYIKVEYS